MAFYFYRYCYSIFRNFNCILLVVILILNWGFQTSNAFGTFGFNIHHRYSDRVKGILDLDGLPERGSHQYYAAMAHRDRIFHGRRLAGASVDSSSLTFSTGNDTIRLDSLGYLYYANVSVGTPSLWFLVALDTGSDLFWLPCDCLSCVRGLRTRSGVLDFNIYSPNTSSTSTAVACNNSMCQQQRSCSSESEACPYQVKYLSDDTSSTGLLVEDVLHLTSDKNKNQLRAVDAQIKFGCGRIQTGSFLDGAAPNGLFGLGMQNISVPSILAREKLAANSFSMCFGSDVGRIRFGDKGSSDQGETPFSLHQLHPTYNISITKVSVGEKAKSIDFTAIFDSGTSFTYLNDPAYSAITEIFDSQAKEKRHQTGGSSNPFEFCYDLRGDETTVPSVNLTLTMKGGDPFYITDPLVLDSIKGGGSIYCLGIVKSEDVNIIGENFMTGYNIVFDREKMVLGWKASDCYDSKESDDLPISPRSSTAPEPAHMHPEATAARTPEPGGVPPPPSSHSQRSSPFHVIVIFCIYRCYSIISFS